MGQTYSGKLKITHEQTYTNVLDLESVTSTLTKAITKNITNGTGANKAQAVWSDTRSLLTTANEEIDLRAIVNGFGTLTAAKIKYIIINPVTVTTGYRLLVGGAASNAWSACFADPSDILRVDSGSPVVLSSLVDGWTVDATHKQLKIENPSGGTFEYEIIVVCEGTVA